MCRLLGCRVLGLNDWILQLMTARIKEEQSGNCGIVEVANVGSLMVRIVKNEMESAWISHGNCVVVRFALDVLNKSPMGSLFDERRASG